MHIGFFTCFHGISLERSCFSFFIFVFQARVVLKQLVSLIGRLVACSPRISVDTHTHRHTDRQQTNYCNPRCACAPRVNKDKLLSYIQRSVDLSNTIHYFSNTYLLLFFHKRANMVGAHVF